MKQLYYVISYFFQLYLILHACVHADYYMCTLFSSQKNFYNTRHIEFLDTCMDH